MITFTRINTTLFQSDSVLRGKVSKKYIDRIYNLGGSVGGDFTLLNKQYFNK